MSAPESPAISLETISPLPSGLIRPSEMITFQVFAIAHMLVLLREYEEYWGTQANRSPHTNIAPGSDEQVRRFLEVLMKERVQLELDATGHRAEMLNIRLRRSITNEEFSVELRILRETILGELNFRYFYHYPRREADRLLVVDRDWAPAFEKFPSCKQDAGAAVDAWALRNGTGCVFHCMRVAEVGLRALARDRKVRLPKDRPLEYAQWEQIIDKTGAEVTKIANWPSKRARARERALTFYRGVLGELHAFKEVRNGVMHARTHFDQARAESVLNHVQGFMNRLAERLDERVSAPIRWGR